MKPLAIAALLLLAGCTRLTQAPTPLPPHACTLAERSSILNGDCCVSHDGVHCDCEPTKPYWTAACIAQVTREWQAACMAERSKCPTYGIW